ncbi:MAG: DNA replication/repair protein RecF [Lachnospiraceae bacterium]|nr:DNA replication/repair protein RecF [Lachnospiraceae bacterium]
MIIESLELKNYRNYEKLDINFDSGKNILYGDNAQGKTNILESIYMCSTTKSHRGAKDREIIRFHEEDAHIKLMVRKKDVPYRIDIHLKKSKTKGIAINGFPIKKSSELFGIINVIFFSPEDLSIIKNGPAERRKFIDMELCQIDKVYLHNLVNYNKIVNQRNRLLKDLSFRFDKSLYDTLDIWDMQLADYGNKIIQRREEFIKQINEIIKDIHNRLSGGKEDLSLCYEPNTQKEELNTELLKNREKDIKLKTTSIGPHRDDIGFYLKELDVRKYGSQGQQRTVALSLKLSEIELVKKVINDTPILLLDDVMSELDSNRQNQLINSLDDIQTIVTCTGLDEFIENRMQGNRIYKIVNGTADLYELRKEQK